MAKQWEIAGIDAELPFAEAAALVVETRAQELLARSAEVLNTERIAAVHDMRVATRRLRAALEVFEPCFPRGPYKKLRKEVKAIADALGERRDRDVAIAAMTEFAESMPRPDRPGIESLIDRYAEERDRANERLAPYVEAKRLQALQEAANALAAEARASVAAPVPAADEGAPIEHGPGGAAE